MLNIMLDGLFILNVYKTGIAVFFVTGFGLGFFIIKHVTNDEMDPGIKLLACFSIGDIALCVISYFLVWMAYFLPFLLRPSSFLILFCAIFVILRGIWLGEFKKSFNPRVTAAGIALFLLLIARLAFLKHIILPSYSDSPIHYQIVSDLLQPGSGSAVKLSLGNIFTQYYHFGFHSLTAWLASITGIAPGDAISLVGQLFLVITPVSIIFLTYFVTKNIDGALFAGLLAATGWFMPAFAVNWGKFPALSSLAVMPALLAFLGYYLTGNTKKTTTIVISVLLLGGVTLLHTRIIICVVFALVSIYLARKLQTTDALGGFQSIRLSVLFIISLWPVYQLILDFYSGIPTLMIWLILLPFAFMAYPRLAVAIFFYTLGSWLIALVPPLLIANSPSLLDRQFLEIMFYIPFSIMGGAGFVGLMRKLPSNGITRLLAALTLSGCAAFIFLQGYSLLPDECCILFKEDDKLAFEWIQKNTSEETLFIISTYNENGQIIGTDAGVWIYPLTGRYTNKLRYDINWDSLAEMKNICLSSANDIYIYMGGGRYSFNKLQLASGKWTSPVYTNGGSVLYQLFGCSK